ncbi:MAG: adenosylcobinamide-GDP ribazoletransferase [Pseudomonadota bacterium]
MINPLLAAFQFLSIVPVRRAFSERDIARSLWFFPVVGLAIGALVSGLVASIAGTPLLAAAIALVLWVMSSGGLHLDGLADSADAWGAARGNPERALEVMKDPRCGPIAVVVVVIVLIVKFAALAAIVEGEQLFGIVLVPVIARTAVIALFLTTPYVSSNGLGHPYVDGLERTPALIALAITALLCTLFGGLILVVAAALALAALRWLMINQINGMTGDTIGGVIEVIEMVALITLALTL